MLCKNRSFPAAPPVCRSPRTQLVQRNVLPSQAQNVAPALTAAALELEKAMKKDKLRIAIAERPSRAALADANLLPASATGVAPALAASAVALQAAMNKDAVSGALKQRRQQQQQQQQQHQPPPLPPPPPSSVDGRVAGPIPVPPPLPTAYSPLPLTSRAGAGAGTTGGDRREVQDGGSGDDNDDADVGVGSLLPAVASVLTATGGSGGESQDDLNTAIDDVRACLREVREFRGWLQAQ